MSLSRPETKPRDPDAEHPAERNLRLNTYALIVSNLLTGALGLVFWIAAARLFPAREVGIAAAQINSAVMLSFLSILSIDAIYERFLPVAGTHARSLLKRGFLLVAAVAAVAGSALVVFGPKESLFDSGWTMASYPLLVVVLTVFALLDKATAGLGVARWSAAKNAVHSLAKLIVIVALAWTDEAVTIVAAWGATAAVAAVYLLIALEHRSRSNPQFLGIPYLPSRQQLWSYFQSSFGLTACWAIGNLAVPLIVLTQVGAEANAYFAVAWAIIIALYVTLDLIVSPYVAEVAAHPDKVMSLTWRMIRTLTLVTCVGSISLVVVAPAMLNVVGAQYRDEGQGLLYLAGIFLPLAAVTAVYEGFARLQRRLRLLLAARFVAMLVMVGGSLILTRAVGVSGVGWACLAAESVAATALLGPAVLWIRRAQSGKALVQR
ncbi:lipopolysaccharide biosynthesis protein [Mycobacterium sp. PS03-16]|uniref:lipopolysaccharide biosynthesis protein n=1 Tax=Mycobacterium sp. PS03-16 TaxID=2559611 RepID=UPI00107339C0|nr:lipopolysaccharide biosynthesis protein [Mycobacterium sp. PS03-16]TFV59922.1 lipopolysaccharide biosynthesis protein [Mycobacterium sp. PS03-16]